MATRDLVWYGAVLNPSAYGACNGFAPRLAVWVNGRGELLSALAATTRQDGETLDDALRIALRRRAAARPACLAVSNECAAHQLARSSAIRVRRGEHPELARIVRGHLAQLAAHSRSEATHTTT